MFSVRVDRHGERYTFNVEPMPYNPHELVALDSTPALIAMVHAEEPGAAAAKAWEKGKAHLASLSGLPSAGPMQAAAPLGDNSTNKE